MRQRHDREDREDQGSGSTSLASLIERHSGGASPLTEARVKLVGDKHDLADFPEYHRKLHKAVMSLPGQVDEEFAEMVGASAEEISPRALDEKRRPGASREMLKWSVKGLVGRDWEITEDLLERMGGEALYREFRREKGSFDMYVTFERGQIFGIGFVTEIDDGENTVLIDADWERRERWKGFCIIQIQESGRYGEIDWDEH